MKISMKSNLIIGVLVVAHDGTKRNVFITI